MLQHEYVWLWETQQYRAALQTLDKAERLAHQGQLAIDRIRIIDQKGVSLQELGRDDEALAAHKQALEMARRKQDDNCIETSLNNLGVVYRKLDKPQAAAEVFREARAIARKQEDFASECMAANNLALALIDMGSLAGARQILQKVARESAERGMHGGSDEYLWATRRVGE